MSDAVFRYLSGIKPFSLLEEELLLEISHTAKEVVYPEGTLLSNQGRPELDELLIVREGSIELYYDTAGKRVLSRVINPGQTCYGIDILINDKVAIQTVITATKTAVYSLPAATYLDICNRNKEFYDFFKESHEGLLKDESYSSALITSRAFEFLKVTDPFSFLPDRKIKEISEQVSIAYYNKDRILFTEGQSEVQYLYIIQKGSAEIYFEQNNQKILRGILTEGQSFGGISMLLNNGIPVRSIKMTEKTCFYLLPKEIFLQTCQKYEVFSEYFTDIFGRRMLNKSYSAIISRTMFTSDDSLQLLNQPITNIVSENLVSCRQDLSIQEGATLMIENHCSSVLITDTQGEYIGIVTDNDLRKKVVSKGYDIRKPMRDIMSTPLQTIPSSFTVFEGLIQLMQRNLKHLAVTDPANKVQGIVSNTDFLGAQKHSPLFIIRQISRSKTREEIFNKNHNLPEMIRNMLAGGAKAKNINNLITTISDGILKKLIEFNLAELDPPPVKFVFLVFGSEGRKEQTLKTDQDNAILFEDVPEEREQEVQDYFLRFGNQICDDLNQAGLEYCQGGIMAKNPKWCQPLKKWKEQFHHWIHTAGPEDLMFSSIFFDFKGAYGELDFDSQLRDYLFDTLKNGKKFFRHLKENALLFKPPLGFFGNFVVESKGKHQDTLDIKKAMQPIVDYARVFALMHGVRDTNTLERLRRLNELEVLSQTDYEEIRQAYSYLMEIRIVHQVNCTMEKGGVPDNYIYPKQLSGLDQRMLKGCFKKVEDLQSRIAVEFGRL